MIKEINKQKGVLMTNQTILATVEKSGNRFNAYDQNCNKITHLISTDYWPFWLVFCFTIRSWRSKPAQNAGSLTATHPILASVS